MDLHTSPKSFRVAELEVVEILKSEKIHVPVVRVVQGIEIVECAVLTVARIRISGCEVVSEAEAAVLSEVVSGPRVHHPR